MRHDVFTISSRTRQTANRQATPSPVNPRFIFCRRSLFLPLHLLILPLLLFDLLLLPLHISRVTSSLDDSSTTRILSSRNCSPTFRPLCDPQRAQQGILTAPETFHRPTNRAETSSALLTSIRNPLDRLTPTERSRPCARSYTSLQRLTARTDSPIYTSIHTGFPIHTSANTDPPIYTPAHIGSSIYTHLQVRRCLKAYTSR